jgi:ribose transport system ATP-binding protein
VPASEHEDPGATAPVALSILSLSKSFEGQRALIDFNMDVLPGEVHALVGQNGSGKSTLIRLLAGFEKPDPGGRVMLGEQELELGSPAAARAAHLCFVHQDLALIETMTVAENIALGVGYTTGGGARIQWRRQRERARQALAAVDSDLNVSVEVGELGSVDRTLVAIARAIAAAEEGGRFIILDEPTASLARDEVERLFKVLTSLSQQGLGVVFVSHYLDEVLELADRITVLRDGRKIVTTNAAELEHETLASLILGRAVEAHAGAGRSSSRQPALSARGLTGASLASVDLEVARGEVLGVAGLVGSGREEVASLLFGAVPGAGSVSVEGREIEPERPDQAIEAGVALVPADRGRDGLVGEMTIAENMTLARLQPYWDHMRLDSKRERAEVLTWIERLDIQPPRPGAPVHTLSGGNQQKVVLAKWLRLDPTVLLLDEPTQGVDVGAKVGIYRAIDHAASGGAAVLLASSDGEELALVCDRVLVLRRGRVHAELEGEISPEQINELCL